MGTGRQYGRLLAPRLPFRKTDKQLHIIVPANGVRGLAVGATVAEYRIERRIGRGGMSEVYAAVHPLIGSHVAIKLIHRHLCGSPGVVERFVREACAVNRVSHPNIVNIFSFGVLDDGRPYLVMELLRGETLADRMQRGRLSLGEIVDVLQPVCAALQASHDQGIIHRDLKPQNIHLGAGHPPQVKLLDFGVAKLEGTDPQQRLTAEGAVVGTPLYIAPEQARGQGVDARADIYSLGAMAYEMILGRPPFEDDSPIEMMRAHINLAPPPPRELWPEVPPLLERILIHMLCKDPAGRPSLMEVQAALAAVRPHTRDAEAELRDRPTDRMGTVPTKGGH